MVGNQVGLDMGQKVLLEQVIVDNNGFISTENERENLKLLAAATIILAPLKVQDRIIHQQSEDSSLQIIDPIRKDIEIVTISSDKGIDYIEEFEASKETENSRSIRLQLCSLDDSSADENSGSFDLALAEVDKLLNREDEQDVGYLGKSFRLVVADENSSSSVSFYCGGHRLRSRKRNKSVMKEVTDEGLKSFKKSKCVHDGMMDPTVGPSEKL